MDQMMCSKVIAQMRSGGYYDRIMASGSELDRVKHYLEIMAGEREEIRGDDLQRPNFPCFPGVPVASTIEATSATFTDVLDKQAEHIIEECLRLTIDDYVWYSPGTTAKTWALRFLYHMGVNFEQLSNRCPRTFEIISSLPRLATDYPWADAAVSFQAANSSLRPHCSVDNLRVRYHLGIDVPPDCGIRVGREYLQWRRGKTLLFNDAMEHEVWNRSDSARIVLIVDTWNSVLTDVEIRALTAGFRKREVRQTYCHLRLGQTNAPKSFFEHLRQQIDDQEHDPLIGEFWPV
jgi:aspartate beta-hydroxylase